MSSYSVISHPGNALPKEYIGLVYSTWLRSLRFGNDYFRIINSDDYFEHYHNYIGKLLRELDSVVRFAVLSDDHDVVLGFSVVRDRVMDYVWVHKENRKIGVGKSLVPANIDTITHLTKTGMHIWVEKCPGWKFNPFA